MDSTASPKSGCYQLEQAESRFETIENLWEQG